MLVQWPTIITVTTWPLLMVVYYRLARREEREAEAQFGQAYRAYRARAPMFLPRLRPALSGADAPASADAPLPASRTQQQPGAL
jgi:hypothetical protein